jgi:HK97 family phage major capsid protein
MSAHVDTEDLIKLLNGNHEKVVKQAEENETKIAAQLTELKSQMTTVEQKVARRPGGSVADAPISLGTAVANSEQFKKWVSDGSMGKVKISPNETKTVVSITSGSTSAGGLIVPDFRPEVVVLPQRKFVLRDLIAPGQTASNLVEFPQQTGRQLNAAVVAEGVLKPQSDLSFQIVASPVRTIAHWFRASRQVLDDAPLLMSTIDSEGRYGLNLAEEAEMIAGDGSGQHLTGILPNATAFSAPFAITSPNQLDVLLQGVAQIEAALYPADAIVLNPLDWRMIQSLKDAMGRWLAGGPFVPNAPVAWNLPLVTSLAIPTGHFLIGAFRYGAQVWDRMDPAVIVSTEDQDNLVKNLVTILVEERLAFGVKAPAAFVYGAFP